MSATASTAPSLDFWFEFASTYSYPAVMRVNALADKAGVAVRFRPFLLGPILKAQGWDTSPFNLYPAKGRHMWRDLERTCADLGLPFRRPEPFPQSSVLAARVALVGLADHWGEDFCRAVYHAEFADGRRIDETATIGAIFRALRLMPMPRSRPRIPTPSRKNSDPKRQRRSSSGYSVRRASRRATANCSGEMTGSNARSPGRNAPADAMESGWRQWRTVPIC